MNCIHVHVVLALQEIKKTSYDSMFITKARPALASFK